MGPSEEKGGVAAEVGARGGSGSAWVLEAVVGEVWASTEERVGVTYAEGLPGPRAAGAEGGTGRPVRRLCDYSRRTGGGVGPGAVTAKVVTSGRIPGTP